MVGGLRSGAAVIRMSYITDLWLAQVDPKTVQKLARHSHIDLTSGVYLDARGFDLTEAATNLDEFRRKRLRKDAGEGVA